MNIIFANDEGTFLYKPTYERERPVEIQSEEDYHKVLRWFREGTTKLLDSRPDVDWSVDPGRPAGIYQVNTNKLRMAGVGWGVFRRRGDRRACRLREVGDFQNSFFMIEVGVVDDRFYDEKNVSGFINPRIRGRSSRRRRPAVRSAA